MNMFLTSILKLFNSLYLSCAFQSNVGCLSASPLTLGASCTGLLLLVGLSPSLTATIAALVASRRTCHMVCIMLCSDAISLYFTFLQLCLTWDCLDWVCLVSVYIFKSALCETSFYFWHHVILHWRKLALVISSVLYCSFDIHTH